MGKVNGVWLATFFCVHQEKEIHTGLEQRGGLFVLTYPLKAHLEPSQNTQSNGWRLKNCPYVFNQLFSNGKSYNSSVHSVVAQEKK